MKLIRLTGLTSYYGRYACLFYFIVYVFISIQEPSVPLAIQLLDGTSFRPGGKTLMSVSVAQFQQRGKFHDLLKPHKQTKNIYH